MDRHFVALLLLAGGLGFVFGGCLGVQLTVSAYGRLDRRRARERRVLNDIWRLLQQEFGIDRARWMVEVLDRKQVEAGFRSRRVNNHRW